MIIKNHVLYSLPYVVGAISSVAMVPFIFYDGTPPSVIVNRSLKSDKLPIHHTISPARRIEQPVHIEPNREIKTKCGYPAPSVDGRCFAKGERQGSRMQYVS